MRRLLCSCALMLAVSLMSGCIVGPDYSGQSTPVPDVWHQQLENGSYVGSQELNDWWTMFNDPALTHLIASAEQHNVDLYAAYTRICQARSMECITLSAKRLTLASTGGLQSSRIGPNSVNFRIPAGGMGAPTTLPLIPPVTLGSLGLDIGWEPDLFGRVERQLQSAEANTCTQVEAYRDVLVTLYADVAQAYMQVRALQLQLRIACQNVELRKASVDLVRKRVKGGVAPNAELFQAESDLALVEASIPNSKIQLHQTLNRLSTLLGQYPGAMHCLLAEPASLPNIPENLPQVIPCDMIRQRPDIRQAERRIVGATADVGAAMAELMPSFSIGGTVSLSALTSNDLFDIDSFGYGLGPSFRWPLLQGGRIRCNVDLQECELEEAVAIYEQTLLRASQEVEDSIVGFNESRVRSAAFARAIESSQKSLESTVALYRAGEVNFQDVLETQRTLFTSENSLVATQLDTITSLITFYRALGGGWDCDAHNRQPCVRVQCPERCPPNETDVTCDPETSKRYFELPAKDKPKRDEGDEEKSRQSLADRIRARGRKDAGESADTEEGDASNGLFDGMLKDLIERLNQTSTDGPLDAEPSKVAPTDDEPTADESLRPRQPKNGVLPSPRASKSPLVPNFNPPRPDTPLPIDPLLLDTPTKSDRPESLRMFELAH